MANTKTYEKEESKLLKVELFKISKYLEIVIVILSTTKILSHYFLDDKLIKNKNMDIVNNIIAPLLVGLITAGFGWLWSLRILRKKIDAAPRKYVQELDNLITRALAEGAENALINARAIVSTRNSLRGSLVSISQHLNSEIDRLATDIGEIIQKPLEPSSAGDNMENLDNRRAYETIIVLSKIWPAKKVQIEYEIRKLLTELGIS